MILLFVGLLVGFVLGGVAVAYTLGLFIGGARRARFAPEDPHLRRQAELHRQDCIRWKRRALRRGWTPTQARKKR